MPNRWINQSQPQSLVNATILLYLNAVIALLFGDMMFILKLAGIAAGFGIANEKKWGYIAGVVIAILPLVWTVLILVSGGYSSNAFFSLVISLLFQILLVGLLLHPASRSYQKIWFK